MFVLLCCDKDGELKEMKTIAELVVIEHKLLANASKGKVENWDKNILGKVAKKFIYANEYLTNTIKNRQELDVWEMFLNIKSNKIGKYVFFTLEIIAIILFFSTKFDSDSNVIIECENSFLKK